MELEEKKVEEQEEQEPEEKETYTREEVERLIDSRISKAYNKWNKEKNKAVAEAERLGKMSEEERQAQYVKDLEEKVSGYERDIKTAENTKACLSECAKRGIPSTFIDFIVCDDADVMLDRLNTFEKALKNMVNEEVKKRLPSSGIEQNNNDKGELTKDDFDKLPLNKQQEIFETNRALYDQLTKN